MALITYNDKVALNENPSIADINKVKASDMNEIKSVVNGLIVNTESTSTTNAYSANYVNECNTYSSSETFTGKYWNNGKKIYRKIFPQISISSGETKTILNFGAYGIDEVIDISNTYLLTTSNEKWFAPSTIYSTSYIFTVYNGVNQLTAKTIGIAGTIKVIVEYTKSS